MTHDIGQVVQESGGLRVVAYPGDNMVLLAMSVDEAAIGVAGNNLAGFAIWRTVQGRQEVPLLNRLSFDIPVTRETQPNERKWTPSSEAPFQKFRWVDVLPDGFETAIRYRVIARYFTGQGKTLRDGPSVSVTVQPPDRAHTKFQIAFTRGYASSQAYAEKFKNADIRPPGAKKVNFDTTPFITQYAWLGADARKHLYAFLDECKAEKTAQLDVFAYDMDEPDIIRRLCEFGTEHRLRVILDNAPLHTKSSAIEVQAAKLIKAAAGAANVKQGHFARFQHNKVFIKRDANGRAQKVFFGSMNFSLRGLYVQANNVVLIDDPTSAGFFATAFDTAFKNDVKAAPFAKAPIAGGYNQLSTSNTPALPVSAVALSPHTNWQVSLSPVADAIHQAQSSVLYAVMEPKGSGPVLDSLRIIAAKPIIFSYGTVESDTGLAVQSGDGVMGQVTSYSYLQGKVPAPFQKEWSGGSGKHIHHKFVVVDFNGENPIVFTGSSNLAAGGEESNGDSLIMIKDPVAAGMYAIEAVRLFDHYAFRKHMQGASTAKPLTLWFPGKPDAPTPWWKPYYDKGNIKFRDRYLFADLPLPAGLTSAKNADWSSLARAARSKSKATQHKKTASTGRKKQRSKPTGNRQPRTARSKRSARPASTQRKRARK